HGAYKYPRELTWVLGVLLLLCTLGMFFTGQILRWDPDAYWGLAVGGSMAGRVPLAGPWVVRLLFGGPVIGGGSLSPFFPPPAVVSSPCTSSSSPARYCSSSPSTFGWCSSGASAPRPSPGRWSIRRRTTRTTKNNSKPASPSSATPC